MLNGADFIYDRIDHLWLVDVATGVASRLTDGPVADTQPAWSPDGRRIAFTSDRGRDPDLVLRSHIHVVDVATRAVTAITAGPRVDVRRSRRGRRTGDRCSSMGGRLPGNGAFVNDLWIFAADGTGRHARRRPQRLAPPRPDAALGDDQRRHGGRAGASGGRRRRDPRRPDRPDRRVVRALADRPGRRPARAADRRPALHLGLGRASRVPRPASGPPTSARRRPSRRTSGSSTAAREPRRLTRSTPTSSTSSSSATRSSGT